MGLKIIDSGKGVKNLETPNGGNVGEIALTESGYVYFPPKHSGYFLSENLREIADILDKENNNLFADLEKHP